MPFQPVSPNEKLAVQPILRRRGKQRLLAAIAGTALVATLRLPAQSEQARSASVRESPESWPAPAGKRTYDVEWRLIRAGTVTLEFSKTQARMHLESSGIVSSLFKVDDVYEASYDEPYCVTSTVMNSMEGKRHHETRVTYDRIRNRAWFVERDLLKNAVIHEASTDIPHCVSDAVSALLRFRSLNLEPGQTGELPVSDGRRFAMVPIKAIEREDVKTPLGTYHAIRYDAGLMNGVIYQRKGHVDFWLTDDARKLAVQIRLRLSFPVGSVTLQLEKEEQP